MEFAYRTDVATIDSLSPHVSDEDIRKMKVQRSSFKRTIRPFVMPSSGIVNGDTIKDTYFPSTCLDGRNYDVFISHSHIDEPSAYLLAAWLHYHCGLSVFVDSMAWGSADELLREIDNKYCIKDHKKNYDYVKRNFTTSHVHAILSMALLETIKNSRYCIFIESKESICMKSGLRRKTLSPWLYEEITYMKLFQPERCTKYFTESLEKAEVFKCAYDASDVSFFPFLDKESLWYIKYKVIRLLD